MASTSGLKRIAPDVWDRIAGQPVSGDALVARLAVADTSDRLLAAMDREGKRHLLVALAPDDGELEDRRSRGIEVTTRLLQLMDGTEGRYLDLVCCESSGFDVFDSLGGELATTLAARAEEPAVAVRRLVGKWRRFWLSGPRPSLGREEQIGLFAELWFLAFWLVPGIGAPRAVEAWRGPGGARHDIELPGCSIEVKGTASSVGRTHRIHGIEQLEPPENGRLLLFSLAVREEGGGMNTLAGLVERLREMMSVDDDTIVRFETRLAQTGYSSHPSEDAALRLRVVDERVYRVADGFPRLTRASLIGGVPSGVDRIDYTISLANLDAYVAASRPGDLDLLAI